MRMPFHPTLPLTAAALAALLAASPAHAAAPRAASLQTELAGQQGEGKPAGEVAALDEQGDALRPATSHAEALQALELDLSLKVGKKMRIEDYPKDAQRARQTGTAMVEVRVAGDGTVHDVALAKSSGHGVLDDRALHVVRRVTKLYMPIQLRGRDHRATVPIGFYLR